jgi:hypothetical protein
MIWRDRTFLYGCAIGIWLSCLLAGLLYLVQSDKQDGTTTLPKRTSNSSITNEQLQTLASARDMIVLTKQEYTKDQQQIKTLSAQIKQLRQISDSAPGQTGNFVYVTIQPGLSLSETADLLNKAGVITDPKSFVKDASNLPGFIKAGIYRFPMRSDNQTILAMLTK